MAKSETQNPVLTSRDKFLLFSLYFVSLPPAPVDVLLPLVVLHSPHIFCSVLLLRLPLVLVHLLMI